MKKTPFLVDLDRGVFGSFLNVSDTAEQDNVVIRFAPMQSWTAKEYPTSVPSSAIKHALNPDKGIPGTESHIVFVYSGGPGSLFGKIIGEGLQEKVNDLNKQLRQLQSENAVLRSELAQAQAGAEQSISRAKSALDAAKKNEGSFGGQQQSPFRSYFDPQN